jgi:hypothetical protein
MPFSPNRIISTRTIPNLTLCNAGAAQKSGEFRKTSADGWVILRNGAEKFAVIYFNRLAEFD